VRRDSFRAAEAAKMAAVRIADFQSAPRKAITPHFSIVTIA